VALDLPPNCQPAHACLDYQAFRFALPPSLAESDFARLKEALKRLGRIRYEALGVTYVDGKWGVLIVPPFGFPELKINFFHDVPVETAQRLLDCIADLLLGGDALDAARTTPPRLRSNDLDE